jgi:nucleoside-diphosphate-sugar epimerase
MKFLVTGGAGMLGYAIVQQLSERGHTVRVLDLNPCPHPDVDMVCGSITDAALVLRACQDVDGVIHTASLISQELGQPPALYDVNVTGTQHIIRACQTQDVARLVYTSSMDVVFDGAPIANGDETLPYAQKHLDYYGTTKMIAEQAVIAANGTQGLTTAVIRSTALYGPGDNHRFPAIIGPALSGRYIRIGGSQSRVSHTYVGNMAHAHVLLAEKLAPDAACAGQAYFITDFAPGNFFDFFLPYLDALNLKYEVVTVPQWLAQLVANLLEWRYAVWKNERTRQVRFSRYSVAAVSEDMWFNHHKATRDFGYQPLITEEIAFQATLAWLAHEWLPTQTTYHPL